MSILVVCPSCGSKLKVPESMAGNKVACPKCAQHMSVPRGVAGRPLTEVLEAQEVRIQPVRTMQVPRGARQPSYPIAEKVVEDSSEHTSRSGSFLGLILACGGAVAVLALVGLVLLLRGRAGSAGEPRPDGHALAPAIGESAPSSSEAEPVDASKSDSSSKKKSKSSGAKKDADGEDAPPASSTRADAGQRVYRNMLKSAVFIINFEILPNKRKVVSSGSGSLIDRENRLVLTNYHVVGESPKVIVFFPTYNNRKLIAEKEVFFEKIREKSNPAPVGTVVAVSKKTDLALVQLDALPDGVVALNMAKRGAVPGQRVHSIGNPGGSNALWLYTSGTVRQVSHQKWRAGDASSYHDFDAQVVETQSPTNPGDSGGPLVNDQGDLVAVTEGGSRQAQLVSIFIHVDEVRALLNSFKSGSIARPSDGKPESSSRKRKPKS